MSPQNRKKLNILRKKLDTLDNALIKIIKKRTHLVKQVLSLKTYRNQIVDKKRIKIILNNIRKKSKFNRNESINYPSKDQLDEEIDRKSTRLNSSHT